MSNIFIIQLEIESHYKGKAKHVLTDLFDKYKKSGKVAKVLTNELHAYVDTPTVLELKRQLGC